MESSPRRVPSRARGGPPAPISTFVGRERELSFLSERLERAARGLGGITLVSGEPGVGKTRLIAEFAELARRDGWLVLTGRAYDTEGMPPYLPFAEAIGEHLHRIPDDDASRRLLATAHEVALLVPGLRGERPASPSTSPGGAADRYRLFEAVADFFLGISATSEATGLLLCFDDLHWADSATLLMFQHFARKLHGSRILLAATFRSEEVDRMGTLFEVLAELARVENDHRLTLEPLTLAETSVLVTSLTGSIAPGETVAAIHSRAQGNPFFLQEMVRHLQGPGGGIAVTAATPAGSGLPEGVRQVVGRRVSRLGSATQKLLESAAVLSDGLVPGLLEAASSLERAVTTTALAEATRAGILREQESSYAFGHPLIRQVLYDGLGPARRQQLHRDAAVAIESFHAAALDRHLSELARHYDLGGTSPEKTIAYATRAGDRAQSVFAFEEALRLYDLALAALSQAGPGREAQASDLRVKKGEAFSGLGLWAEARASFEAAAEDLAGEERADALLKLAIAAATGVPDVTNGGRHAGLAAEFAREVNRPDLEMAATALVSHFDYTRGEFKVALAGYDKAYAQANTLPPRNRHQGFAFYPLVLYYFGRLDEAVAVGREIVASAVASHDVLGTVGNSPNLGIALTGKGLYEEAMAAFALARKNAAGDEGAVMRSVLSRAVGMSASVHMATFDFGRAEELAEETRDLGRSSNFILSVVSEDIDLAAIAIYRGNLGRAAELVEEATGDLDKGGGSHGKLWRARLANLRADLAVAASDWRGALPLAAEALLLARALGRPKYEAQALIAKGRALLGLGRKHEALVELRGAVEVARPVGDPAMVLRAGAALLSVEGDETLAVDTRGALDRMLDHVPEHMEAGLEAAEPARIVFRLTGNAGSPQPSRILNPGGLTEREVEVLRLLADGQSNRDIANNLVISVRTVERHITNIYAKIGARGKADATAYALRNSLA